LGPVWSFAAYLIYPGSPSTFGFTAPDIAGLAMGIILVLSLSPGASRSLNSGGFSDLKLYVLSSNLGSRDGSLKTHPGPKGVFVCQDRNPGAGRGASAARTHGGAAWVELYWGNQGQSKLPFCGSPCFRRCCQHPALPRPANSANARRLEKRHLRELAPRIARRPMTPYHAFGSAAWSRFAKMGESSAALSQQRGN